VPTVAGGEVAQELARRPKATGSLLRSFEGQLVEYYQGTGMMNHDPERARMLIVRNLLRAVSAPLLHAVEVELDTDIWLAQQVGQPLVRPEYVAVTGFDRRLRGNRQRQFTDEEMRFLRVSSALSHTAALRFIGHIQNDSTFWARPIWDAFWEIDSEAAFMPFPRDFKMRDTPRERLKDHITDSNVIALAAIKRFFAHREHAQAKHISELSRLSSTKRDFFGRHFPDQGTNPQLSCPFNHEQSAGDSGGLWNLRPLASGPLPVPGYCPDNIPFYTCGEYVTGAELRLRSAMAVTAETLSYASPEVAVGPMPVPVG